MNLEMPISSRVSEIPFNKFPKDFTWERFEDLCKALAKEEYKIQEIRPFGTKGDNQEGIDIYAYDINKKKYLTIQCKRVKNFSPQKIKDAVNIFLAGQFKTTSYTFILACTDDLSIGLRQKELINQERILAALGIEFLKWDYIGINDLLRRYPKIVGSFFSKEYVKAFNGEEAFEEYMKSFKTIIPYPKKINYELVSDYIPRVVSTLEEYNKKDFFFEKKSENLTSILEGSTEVLKNKLILLSEGGYGKSAELLNIANHFSNEKRKQFPIKIDLGNCIEGQEIEKMLYDKCEGWEGVDDQLLMLLFDGLDEVSEKEYLEFIKRINSFHEKHYASKIIISSRTNHFNTFNGQNLLRGFEILFLNDLGLIEIDKFLTNKLRDNKECFNALIDEHGFRNLLSSPFYLIYLTEIFTDTYATNSFPKSKADIFSSIIEKHFEKDNEKFASIGINIIIEKKKLTKLLKLIAFSMTQLGKNNLSLSELQLLVPNEFERKLLRYSSLLDYKNNVFQFIHNLVQEYLTALCIKEFDLEVIQKLIAFEPDFSKIKNKWHNPLSFLISALPENNEKNNQIIEWIIKIEPEILINMEVGKFSNRLRFDIAKKIIEKYKEKEIHIPYYYFDDSDLGKFAGNTKKLLEYCLNEVEITTPVETKILCIRIIQNFDNYFGKEKEVKTILEQCAIHIISSSYLQQQAIRGIAVLGKFINVKDSYWFLKKNCKNIQDLDVRNGIYNLIEALPFEEDFLDFAIEGVALINKSKGVTQMGEEKPLETILLKSCSPKDVRKVLNFLSLDKGLLKGSYSNRITFDHDFLDQIINNAIIAYSEDKNIINDIYTLIENLHYRFFHDKFHVQIIRFFAETDTTQLAFKFFYAKAKIASQNKNWIDIETMLIFSAKKDLIKLYSDYEKGIQNKDLIFSCRNSLQNINKELHGWYYKFINKKSNNRFEYAKGNNFDWEKHRQNQRIKDQSLLLNKALFLKEVQRVFRISGKMELTKEELRDYQKSSILYDEKHNNTIVIPLLREWAELGKIDYKIIAKKYKDEKRWQGYVINEVVRILTNKQEVTTPLKQYVIDYVYLTLPEANLEESVTDLPGGGFEYTIYSSRLNLFCEKWEMTFNQSQLLDLLYTDFQSVYEFEEDTYKKRPSNYVLNKILDKNIIKNRILFNMKDKKLAIPVLGSHFYLCKKLKINESKVFLYKELEQTRFSEHEKIRILDMYIELGGEISDLLDIFKSYKKLDYWYWHLADKLLNEEKEEVIKDFVKILNSNATNEDEKITASLKLLHQARIEGLHFFCQFIEKNKRSPYDYHFMQNFTDLEFPMKESLDLLFKILAIPFSQPTLTTAVRHFDRLDEAIYSLIFIIGLQSEEAYFEVIHRYNQFIKENKTKLPLVKNINYPIVSLENQYYKNKEEKIMVEDVVSINKKFGLM
jgi:hypothetical protein